MCIYIYIYTHISLSLYIYIYIYTYIHIPYHAAAARSGSFGQPETIIVTAIMLITGINDDNKHIDVRRVFMIMINMLLSVMILIVLCAQRAWAE